MSLLVTILDSPLMYIIVIIVGTEYSIWRAERFIKKNSDKIKKIIGEIIGEELAKKVFKEDDQ